MRSATDRVLAVRLATEWLERFDKLPVGVELELIDALVDSGKFETLRTFADAEAKAGYDTDERRRNWIAIGLLCDFEQTRRRVEPVPAEEKDLLWHLRYRFRGGRDDKRLESSAEPAQLAWIVEQFRKLWPYRDHPLGVSSGDVNDWDATEFIRGTINHLATDTSPAAADALAQLVAGEQDEYTNLVLYAKDMHRQTRRELAFAGVSLERLRDVVKSLPPRTSDDLLAILQHTLARLQLELRGNDTDSIVKYWRDDDQPRYENRCTDALTEDLARLLPNLGIVRTPQADMPKGKIVDLLYAIGDAALPIECKGQWNPKLWTAAGEQLDAFYMRDWRVQDRGIYLVFWFGTDVDAKFKLKIPSGGAARPETPEQLREALTASIPSTRRGSIWVEVLDLTQ